MNMNAEHFPQGSGSEDPPTQDCGTFEATSPCKGGFLRADGTPVGSSSLHIATVPRRSALPIDTESSRGECRPLIVKLAALFLGMLLVITLLVLLLIITTRIPSIGVVQDISTLLLDKG